MRNKKIKRGRGLKMSYLIGIDIGGTNLRSAVISKEGEIIDSFIVENEVSKGALYNLNKIVHQIIVEWSNYEIEKVGVGYQVH